jgi:hypothetical protein
MKCPECGHTIIQEGKVTYEQAVEILELLGWKPEGSELSADEEGRKFICLHVDWPTLEFGKDGYLIL